MKLTCPECRHSIASQYINVHEDLVICKHCKKEYVLADFVDESTTTRVKKVNQTTVISTSTSGGIGIFILPIISIFTGLFTYSTFMALSNNVFNGVALFVFLLFSILLTIFWMIAVMALKGKVELILDVNGGIVFIGIGKLGLRRKFKWTEISKIEDEDSWLDIRAWVYFSSDIGYRSKTLKLNGAREITFIFSIQESQRENIKRAFYDFLNGLDNQTN